jgi:hypothetical protein
VAKGINQVCARCGVIHFQVVTERDGDLVHYSLVVTKWPCAAPAVTERPRLADMVATALVSETAA